MPRVGRRRQTDLHLPPRMRRKGSAYYYDAGGKPRVWIPLGSDEGIARMKWAELSNEAPGHTVRYLIQWFFTTRVPQLAANTRRNYASFRKPIEAVFGDVSIRGVRTEHIATYLDDHHSPAAANNQIGMLSAMYEKALRRGWADRNPCKGIRRNTLKRRGRYLTDTEYRAIREAAPPTLRAAIDISYITGLRPVDVVKIRRDDERPEGLYVEQQKTGRRQIYTITAELKAALATARALNAVASVFLLCDRRGQPITTHWLGRQFRVAARAAGIQDAQLRDLRAKAATDAKDLGQDYQAILGHATRAMSDSYIKDKIINKVEPLRRKL